MKRKILTLLISLCAVAISAVTVYALVKFYSVEKTVDAEREHVFQFEIEGLPQGIVAETGPGDIIVINPVIYNSSTEEMYVFIQVKTEAYNGDCLYSFDVKNGWKLVEQKTENGVYTAVYAYVYDDGSMYTLLHGEKTEKLTDAITMQEMSYPEYADISDISITFAGYAMITINTSTNPSDAWNECKQLGNID